MQLFEFWRFPIIESETRLAQVLPVMLAQRACSPFIWMSTGSACSALHWRLQVVPVVFICRALQALPVVLVLSACTPLYMRSTGSACSLHTVPLSIPLIQGYIQCGGFVGFSDYKTTPGFCNVWLGCGLWQFCLYPIISYLATFQENIPRNRVPQFS